MEGRREGGKGFTRGDEFLDITASTIKAKGVKRPAKEISLAASAV